MNPEINNSPDQNQGNSVLDDPELLRYRLKKVGKNQTYLSRVFKRSPKRVSDAFKGNANMLLSKIARHIEILEGRI